MAFDLARKNTANNEKYISDKRHAHEIKDDPDLSSVVKKYFEITGNKKDFAKSKEIIDAVYVDAVYDDVGYSGERSISMAISKTMANLGLKKIRLRYARGYSGIKKKWGK